MNVAAVATVAETLPAPAPVAACGCGRAYDLAAWLGLASRRPWDLGGEVLEIAECDCGSTISALPVEVEVAA